METLAIQFAIEGDGLQTSTILVEARQRKPTAQSDTFLSHV